MNKGDTDPGALTTAVLEHVDAVCDRFERACRSGQKPRIEDYLRAEPEPRRSALAHELLRAELEWRRRSGESPEPVEYLERLAGYAPQVLAAFRAATPLESRPGPGTMPTRAEDRGPDATLPHVSRQASAASQGTAPAGGPRYSILGLLAEGGLGVVYRARDEELHREVAVKEIQPRLAARPETCARFLREAEITGGLEHPGIVPVYSLGQHADRRPYYAMRLVQGMNLKEAIDAYHRLPSSPREAGPRTLALRKLLDRFRDVCEALAYAHSRGVVHRDVKPQNILVGPYGETLVVDWGLAKATGHPDPRFDDSRPPIQPVTAGDSEDTAADATIGTPSYMSPEQAAGHIGQLGPESDIYSLGATLYNLLTGRSAFEGRLPDVLERVRRGISRSPARSGAIYRVPWRRSA